MPTLKQIIIRTCLFLWFIFNPANVVLSDAQTIFWARSNYPPFFIQDGKFADKGFVDQHIDFYIKSLPQYNHVKINSSLQRILKEMQNGKPFCHSSLLKTAERKKYIDYSPPNAIYFENGVITSAKKASLFNAYLTKNETLNFERLVEANRLTLKYHATRAYSKIMDAVLARYKGNADTKLLMETGLKQTTKTVMQLIKGNLHGFLGRPAEAFYAARQLNLSDRIRFIPIDGHQQFALGYIGCSKGAWNKQFMKDLADIVYEIRTDEKYIQPYLNWIPHGLSGLYKQKMKTIFADPDQRQPIRPTGTNKDS